MEPISQDLKIIQGATFRWPFYWYSDTEVVKTITSVSRGYPSTFTAVAHGLPASAVPASILNVGDWIDTGLAKADRVYVTKTGADDFKVEVNSAEESAYSGSAGRLVYNEPMNLAAGWTARMHVRESRDATDILQAFTSAGTSIELGSDGRIELVLDDADTNDLDFASAVYDLELEDSSGNVYRVAQGKVTLSPQVTRS